MSPRLIRDDRSPRRSRSGLTLVELLVVLTIIGFLAACLYPVLAAARKSARMTACASNLHQLGLAIAQYQADYAGALPPREPLYHRPYQQGTAAYDPLRAYTGVVLSAVRLDPGSIYRCPEDLSLPPHAISYLFRFEVDLMPGAHGDQHGPADPYRYYYQHVRPGPNTVIVFCDNHTGLSTGGVRTWTDANGLHDDSLGPFVVLRENGAVQRIAYGKVTEWFYHGETWSTDSSGSPDGYPVFPDEPWPPELYCDPGECLGLPH